jgi:hypothetical protein
VAWLVLVMAFRCLSGLCILLGMSDLYFDVVPRMGAVSALRYMSVL